MWTTCSVYGEVPTNPSRLSRTSYTPSISVPNSQPGQLPRCNRLISSRRPQRRLPHTKFLRVQQTNLQRRVNTQQLLASEATQVCSYHQLPLSQDASELETSRIERVAELNSLDIDVRLFMKGKILKSLLSETRSTSDFEEFCNSQFIFPCPRPPLL